MTQEIKKIVIGMSLCFSLFIPALAESSTPNSPVAYTVTIGTEAGRKLESTGHIALVYCEKGKASHSYRAEKSFPYVRSGNVKTGLTRSEQYVERVNIDLTIPKCDRLSESAEVAINVTSSVLRDMRKVTFFNRFMRFPSMVDRDFAGVAFLPVDGSRDTLVVISGTTYTISLKRALL